jgi:hypothetical protein
MKNNKKELLPEQREELFSTLKARFEKNMNRHQGLNGLKYRKSWKPMLKSSGRSMKWKELAVNRMLLVMIKSGEYIFYDCSAESPKGRRSVCYDGMKRWSQGKNINRKIALLRWLLPWALKF